MGNGSYIRTRRRRGVGDVDAFGALSDETLRNEMYDDSGGILVPKGETNIPVIVDIPPSDTPPIYAPDSRYIEPKSPAPWFPPIEAPTAETPPIWIPPPTYPPLPGGMDSRVDDLPPPLPVIRFEPVPNNTEGGTFGGAVMTAQVAEVLGQPTAPPASVELVSTFNVTPSVMPLPPPSATPWGWILGGAAAAVAVWYFWPKGRR
jgi:hypothetical protein